MVCFRIDHLELACNPSVVFERSSEHGWTCYCFSKVSCVVACNVGIVDAEGNSAGWDHTNFADRFRYVVEAAGSMFISTDIQCLHPS
jgi:hypothetical protein